MEANGLREKDYTIRIGWCTRRAASICGAWCRPTGELRTFAVERIRRVSHTEETFTPIAELDADPFTHSMGAYRAAGTATSRIQLRFHPRLAPYIRERAWNPSQRLKDRADGSVVLTMDVCDDYTLRSWILSFGRGARVLAPAPLVEWVSEELAEAGPYGEGGPMAAFADDMQPHLPFAFARLGGA